MITLPTPLTDWRCDLRAVDHAKNVARAYSVHIAGDLFGHWVVDLCWGRLGTSGTGVRVSFDDDGAARRFVERVLARRASAPRRIGVPYRLN
ncbi:WGR domain-containing protein [Sphingobium sufflavum]|uniref:WGR domain-containing protein n=1 Tax=Sphingobium sufflavum TaxID=1129547 RepID=UPI001F1ADFD8|nr:WGR domain-containing protein [Sphingobium sufflavum]MCE7798123.1 WGR domain-containing protein [Sphingobium sufflavum]